MNLRNLSILLGLFSGIRVGEICGLRWSDLDFTNNTIIPKDPRAVEKYFASVLKRVGIKELNFHSLRHTFATRLREQNVDIKVISELLGHSD